MGLSRPPEQDHPQKSAAATSTAANTLTIMPPP